MDGTLWRVGRREGSEVGGGEGWAAGGGFSPPLGLFRLAMGPRSASHMPKMIREPKRNVIITGVSFRLMPSM